MGFQRIRLPLQQLKRMISCIVFLSLLLFLFQPLLAVQAAVSLSIAPITWNVIGLDSNNVLVGPNNFPIGARVCNTGTTPAARPDGYLHLGYEQQQYRPAPGLAEPDHAGQPGCRVRGIPQLLRFLF